MLMTTSEIYISPDKKVLATSEVRPMFQSGISRYPLERGKWYKLSEEVDIPISPRSSEFIWVIQYDLRTSKPIPHKPEHFLTMQQWREDQIMKLNEEDPNIN
jgi:hypothetical protein